MRRIICKPSTSFGRAARRGLLLTVGLMLLSQGNVWAHDNVPGQHWLTQPTFYRRNSALPADWKDAVYNGAARAWNERSAFRLSLGSDTTSTDPATNGDHIIWRGDIPAAWQTGCPVSDTLACTRYKVSSQNTLSIYDTDTVFNQTFSLGASSTNCAINLGYDVQTVMLHEFGHWGYLSHTVDLQAVMFASYHGCQRLPTQHDIDSMNDLYGVILA